VTTWFEAAPRRAQEYLTSKHTLVTAKVRGQSNCTGPTSNPSVPAVKSTTFLCADYSVGIRAACPLELKSTKKKRDGDLCSKLPAVTQNH
jgi:hypothetical protein